MCFRDVHPNNGEVCCGRENQDAVIFSFAHLPCNTEGNSHLQNWFNIPLIAMTRDMCALLAICYIYMIHCTIKVTKYIFYFHTQFNLLKYE